MYQQTIDLNIIPSGVPPVVHVNQYETQLNAFIFNLYKGNEPFAIPNNAAVLFNGLKPDGNVFSFAAASTSGNTAICNCEQQMVPLAGDVVCELRVRTASEIVGTLNFILRVEEAPLHDDSVISETTIPLIEQAIDIAANLAEYIETTLTARDDAVASAAAAKESEDNAAIYNSNVEQTYNSIETAKQNANTAAASASAVAAKLSNISATATTLSEGSSATASYDSNTGVMTFGIPRGATGESGIQTPISGMYALAIDDNGDLYCYSNDEITESMFYYDEEEGNLYWMSPTTPIVTSVSGNMVTFVNKSSAENAVDVTSDIVPIQSFNGYDFPWAAGAGKNKLPYPYGDGASKTTNGITYTVDANGVVTANGTATADNVFYLVSSGPSALANKGLSSGTYVLNGSPSSSNSSNYYIQLQHNVTFVSSFASGTTFTYDASGGGNDMLRIYVKSGAILNNVEFKPMIRPASVSDATYAPYSNICPISGLTGTNVYVSPTTDATDGTTYTIAFPTEAGTVYGGTLDVTTGILTVDRAIKSSGWERTTIDSSGKCWRIGPLPGCINYGANENVSTICNSGPVTNLEQARAASGVCFADFANSLWVAGYANNPDALDAILPSLTVVYSLAEPITYQITPQNIKILKGTNNIWSDSGDVTVKYNRWELE